MLGKCFGIICGVSVLFAALTENIGSLSNAVFDGAVRSVEVIFSLLGMMCLWCGVMRTFSEAGLMGKLAHLLSPIARRIFPETAKSGVGMEEITASIAANILGVGNAATPMAIKAMEKMDAANPTPVRATDDMVTFSVLSCASIDILPTTIIAMRRAADSPEPYKVIVPIWIASVTCAAFGVLLSRALCVSAKRRLKRRRTGEIQDGGYSKGTRERI